MKVLILGGVSHGKELAVKRLLEKLCNTAEVLIIDRHYGLAFDEDIFEKKGHFIEEVIPNEDDEFIFKEYINENLKQQHEKPKNQTIHCNNRIVYRSIHYRNKKPTKRM